MQSSKPKILPKPSTANVVFSKNPKTNGSLTSNHSDCNDGESNSNKTFIEQLFQTSSNLEFEQSFDSSSSSTSSGGFKEASFVTKTKVAFESNLEKKDTKVQEIQKKMLALQQQNPKESELSINSIVINRQNVQKSSREHLEKVLGSHNKNLQQKVNKSGNKFSKNFDQTDVTNVSLQIQKKLTEEACEMIKEKFLVKKTPVQQHYLVIKHKQTNFCL